MRSGFARFVCLAKSDPVYAALLGSVFLAPFTLPFGRLLLALALVLLVIRQIRLRQRPSIPVVAWLGVAFIVQACIVTVYGVHPEIGCNKLQKLAWFAGIPVTALVVSNERRLQDVFKALAAGMTVLALSTLVVNPIAALCAVHAGVFTSFGDALINEGSMTDGQRLAVGLLASLGLLAARRVQRRRPGGDPVLLGAIVVQAVAFVLNFKRGSWIAALLAIGLFVVIKIKWKGALLLGLIVAASLFLPPVKERLGSLKTEFEPYHGGRMTMWRKIAPALIKRYPWGVGYRSLTNEMMREIAPEVESNRNHLHSNLFQLLVTTGWIGLALYMAWMTRALWDSWRFFRCARDDDGGEKTLALSLLLMLTTLLLNGLVEYNFGDAELVLLYGFILGCAAAGFTRQVAC